MVLCRSRKGATLTDIFHINNRVVLLKSISNNDKVVTGYQHLKTFKVKADAFSVKYKDKPFVFNLANASYIKGRTRYLYVDVDSGDTLTFLNYPESLSARDWDLVNQVELAKAAFRGAVAGNMGLFLLIAVAAACFFAGLIIGQQFFPREIPVVIPAQ